MAKKITPVDGLGENLLGRYTEGEHWADGTQIRFENRVVNYLFSRFRLPTRVRDEMARTNRDAHGFSALTLEAFCAAFPSFPVNMGAKYLFHVKDSSPLEKILRSFPRLPFATAFSEFASEFPEEIRERKTLALAFNWPYLPRGASKASEIEAGGIPALIIHNGPDISDIEGTRIRWLSERKESLCVTTISVWCAELDAMAGADGWRPEEDDWVD